MDLKQQVAECDRLHNAGDAGTGAALDALVVAVAAALPGETPPQGVLLQAVAELASTQAEGPEIQERLAQLIQERRIERPAAPPAPLEGTALTAEEPPPRTWLIDRWIPRGRLCSLYGAGGAGKSRLALQMAAAVMEGGVPIALDRDAKDGVRNDHETTGMGTEREGGQRVLWLSWEDERDEFIRRWCMAHRAGAIRAAFPSAERLTLVDMRALGGALWAPGGGVGTGHVANRATWTEAGRQFLATLQGHALAVVDPIAAAYASSENDRPLVRAFGAALDREAERTGCAVLLIGHPSKGEGSGGYSGSTDWRNAVRAMMVLEPSDETGHVMTTRDAKGKETSRKAVGWRLRLDKASYAREGAQIWLERHYAEVVGPDGGQRPALAWLACSAEMAARVHAKVTEEGSQSTNSGPSSGSDINLEDWNPANLGRGDF